MSKITQSARGQDCQVRIPGVCISGGDNETTVFAHLNGGGMGMKHPDSEGSYCCAACHDVVDGRSKLPGIDDWESEYGRASAAYFGRLYISSCFHEGCVRTRKILIEKGLIILK